jgi:hypothetical protein
MSIHDINSEDFESADTGSHPMSWQWWHEIAESPDKEKTLIKSGSYINYVSWKSVTVDKHIVQQFHYKRNHNNRIIEYSSSLQSYDYDESAPTITFSLIE